MRHTRRTTIIAAVGAALAAGAAGGAFAVAGGGDDGDHPATGPDADRARAAALKATGGGTANAVERDTENGATWEVEVTKPDGTTVDVRLDQQLGVVVIEADHEDADEPGDQGGEHQDGDQNEHEDGAQNEHEDGN